MPVSDERVTELTEKLESGIMELYASGQYAEYIAAMSKFHNYSFRNAILILLQCPGATRVAGYRTWQELGRYVSKGQQGIMILFPCSYDRALEKIKTDPATGQPIYGPDGKPVKEKEYIPTTIFKVGHVFDISQTEGKELPALGVDELDGEVENFTDIYDHLVALSPVPVEVEDIDHRGAKGYMSHTEGTIGIKKGMSQVQTIKTLVHEVAHAMLHDPAKLPHGEDKTRREKEVEAESVAYVVCQHFGIDTSDYSLGYVAGWSKDKELEELKSSLEVIHSTAGKIIDAISPPPPEIKREPRRSRGTAHRKPQKARR